MSHWKGVGAVVMVLLAVAGTASGADPVAVGSGALGGGVVTRCTALGHGELDQSGAVKVLFHLMEARLDLTDQERMDRHKGARNLYVPEAHGLSKAWGQHVDAIWAVVKSTWAGHGVKLSLAGVEQCEYEPAMLRLDSTYSEPCDKGRRACRDSVTFPDDPTSTPWSPLLFRSINKLFVDRTPDVLHVLVWWWIGETAIFRDSPSSAGGGAAARELLTPALDAAYARAAGRGGPAVWISTYGCIYLSTESTDLAAVPVKNTAGDADRRACGRLLAHEIGHAFGLHHVQKGDVPEPDRNLMRRQPIADGLEGWQVQAVQDEARRRFNSR